MSLDSPDLVFWLPLLLIIGAAFTLVFLRKKFILSAIIALLLLVFVLLVVLNTKTLVLPWQTTADPPVTVTANWISEYHFNIIMVLDSFSGWMIVMTLLAAIVCFLFSAFVEINPCWSKIFILLILTGSTMGVFLARDIYTFLFSWGAWLVVPFCINSGDGNRQRTPGCLKFFVFHLFSLIAIAAGFSFVHFSYFIPSGIRGLDFTSISRIPIPESSQQLVFILFMIGFGIRMPLFPLHSWLSDTLTEMPASISAFLTSTGLATGIYSVHRFVMPLCPDISLDYKKYMIFAALLSMIYSAMVALMNPHLLQRLGFVTMCYAGLSLLGLFSLNETGTVGAILTSANFIAPITVMILFTGWLTVKAKTALMQDIQGLQKKYPLACVIILLVSMTLVGIPGLNLFSGLFLIIAGILLVQPVWAAIAIVAFLILGTGILWVFQKMVTGNVSPVVNTFNPTDDLKPGRFLIPLAVLIIWLGFFPQYMIHSFTDSANSVSRYIQSHRVLRQTEPGMTPMELFLSQQQQR
jgi:NADH-quinone oxidoreductase subunit M